jgi:hypothetical protein
MRGGNAQLVNFAAALSVARNSKTEVSLHLFVTQNFFVVARNMH